MFVQHVTTAENKWFVNKQLYVRYLLFIEKIHIYFIEILSIKLSVFYDPVKTKEFLGKQLLHSYTIYCM